MKWVFLLLTSIVSFTFLYSCSEKLNNNEKLLLKNDLFHKQVNKVEIDLASNLSANDKLVKLIGYKTIYLDNNEAAHLKKLRETNRELFENRDNYYFSENGRLLRVYFPMHTAIVRFSGNDYIADENGIVDFGKVKLDNSITIVGREKTSLVRGTGSNIIKNDKLLLKNIISPNKYYKDDNVFVFDLGIRSFNGEAGHSCCGNQKKIFEVDLFNQSLGNFDVKVSTVAKAVDDGRISCYDNHGGKNCSVAFNIDKGRCSSTNLMICMDYNGWFTDCINGKLLNFIGSDCDYAMGAGHC